MTRSRLSPHQKATTKFPVVGERAPSSDMSDWQLEVAGLVRQPLRLPWEEFLQLPMVEETWDTICVTGWTHLDHRWRGVSLDTLLSLAEPKPAARFIRFVAYSSRHHDTSLPLTYARQQVLLAHEVDGAPLTVEHGAPVRAVCHGKYFYKSVKWLRRVELLAEDQPGYWERESAYHNNADPWKEERYKPQPMRAEEFQQRVASGDFSDAVAIKDEQFRQLRGVDFSSANFAGAKIKACDLSGITLRKARCDGANFTRSKFRETDLEDASLVGCDLEGADLRGANLSHADMRATFLTAAQFIHQHQPARIAGARFLRRDVEDDGVNEDEQRFLLDPGQGARIE